MGPVHPLRRRPDRRPGLRPPSRPPRRPRHPALASAFRPGLALVVRWPFWVKHDPGGCGYASDVAGEPALSGEPDRPGAGAAKCP
jgi:hypothetical protein